MTNEDVIDLYDRAGVGTVVVVLEPKHGDSPFNSEDGAAGRCQFHPGSSAAPRTRISKSAGLYRRLLASALPAPACPRPSVSPIRLCGFGFG